MNESVNQLCRNCGLCCDSALFADVELRAGDDAGRLQRLGLTLFQKTKTRPAFSQPCACFDGKLCRIYAERPQRCGLFECGLLKKVDAQEMSVPAALEKIAAAKTQADAVRGLLRSLGQQDERVPLTHRYAAVMRAPIDLADENSAERRGELMLAVGDLMQRLERDFLR